jgi:hypothetical protein
MVQKRMMIISIVIIIILVLASIGYFLLNQTPPETLAERTILKPSDLGSSWYYGVREPYSELMNISSGAHAQFGESTGHEFDEWLYIFNSTADCNLGYQIRSPSNLTDGRYSNYSEVQIGDRGYICNYDPNYGHLPFIVFQRGEALCVIWTDSPSDYGFENLTREYIIYLAIAQLQKINSNV